MSHEGVSSVSGVRLMQQCLMDLCLGFNGETCKVEAEFCCCLKQLRERRSEVVLSSDDSYELTRSY